MIRIASLFLLSTLAGFAAAPAEDSASFEQKVRALVDAPTITIVHFWAPWCSNCQHEMRPEGWAKFATNNPEVKIVFINIWHQGVAGRKKLAAAGLEKMANLVSFDHPNASNSRGEKLDRFLGLAVGWVPTTWVYREGKLRYAINYGEVRFEMLQQMVDDAGRGW